MRAVRVVVVLGLLLAPLSFPAVPADYVALRGELPLGRTGSALAYTGNEAYLFGGCHTDSSWQICDPVLGDILRIDGATGAVTTMGASLSPPRQRAAAAWDGRYAWIFGGCAGAYCETPLSQIVRYDPQTDTAQVVASLPTTLLSTTALRVGGEIWLFGGRLPWVPNQPVNSDQVLKFDPATLSVSAHSRALPERVQSAAVVWKDGHAYVLGGDACRLVGRTIIDHNGPHTVWGEECTKLASAWRWFPGQSPVVLPDLPVPLSESAVAFDGRDVYLFGGCPTDRCPLDGSRVVRRFDTVTQTWSSSATLVGQWARSSAFWHAGGGWMIGGYSQDYRDYWSRSQDTVFRFYPTPSAPQALAAARGPEPGAISLSWAAPADRAHLVESYRVRASIAGSAFTLIAEVASRSFVHEGLPAGAQVAYRVTAWTGAAEGSVAAITALAPAPPAAPLAFASTRGPSLGEIRITWAAPADAGGLAIETYRVRRVESDGSRTLLQDAAAFALTDTGRPVGDTVRYEVSAVNPAGEGAAAAIEAPAPGLASAPREPRAASPAAGQVALAWDAPADDGGLAAAGYRVYTRASEGNTELAGETTSTGFTHAGLPSGQFRTYWIRAMNAAGEGPASAEIVAGTSPPPSAPRSPITSAGPGKGELTLRWTAPASDNGMPVTGYRIYAGSSPSSLSLLTETTSPTFVHTGLPDGTNRYYQIAAVNAMGESPRSPPTSGRTFSIPSAPRNLEAKPGLGLGEAVLTWQIPISAGGIVPKYRVYRWDSASELEVLLGETTSLTWTDRGTKLLVFYEYHVAAYNPAGTSPRASVGWDGTWL